MFINEIILFIHTSLISLTALGALRIGKDALMIFSALGSIFANLFVLKQIKLFGLYATPTDAFYIGAVFSINLLNEYYGRKQARRAIWLGFASALFFVAMAHIHLFYVPHAFDHMHEHYTAILTMTPRIIAASLIAYFVSQQVEYRLYAWLKKQVAGRFLVARNWFSLSISQLLDTVLFSFLGLAGIVENLFHIITISYSIKLITIVLVSPFMWLATFIKSQKT